MLKLANALVPSLERRSSVALAHFVAHRHASAQSLSLSSGVTYNDRFSV